MFPNQEPDNINGFANLAIGSEPSSQLMQMLVENEMVPGQQPGYQLCKLIYLYHPLGAVLTEAPVKRALAKERKISIGVVGEERLIEQYKETWNDFGEEGATNIILDLMAQTRTYGQSCLVVDDGDDDRSKPLDLVNIGSKDVRFHVFDPLVTAGSQTVNQDPSSSAFLYTTPITVKGVTYDKSRTLVKFNERPVYLAWEQPAYGFSGRSVFQRAVYPLRSYIQTMITDDMVTKKAALMIAKMQAPGTIFDRAVQTIFGWKRGMLKSGNTGNVISMGIEESVETIDFKNLEGPYALARMNVIKNIATACSMPASIIAQETLTEGFGEGTEDYKKEVQYLDHLRNEMRPIFKFVDAIVQRKAWTKEFYDALRNDDAEAADFYKDMTYEAALQKWIREYHSEWPNLMEEPDGEKAKMEKVRMEAAIGVTEVNLPVLSDPKNKMIQMQWLADQCNANKILFVGDLQFDADAMEAGFEEADEREADQADADLEAQASNVPNKPRVRAA